MADKDTDFQHRFLRLALERGNLRFGEFTLKSGRVSPYFFNAGGFDDGASLDALAQCYAAAIMASGVEFDMLFGPAYKGIPLAASIAIALNREHGRNVPFAFDRKEIKPHGEGGKIVGAPLSGRVLIVDDVISAGTSVRAAAEDIRALGAEPAGVAIALDRQERGSGQRSAVQEVEADLGLPVVAIATLAGLLEFLEQEQSHGDAHADNGIDTDAIRRYRDEYGC